MKKIENADRQCRRSCNRGHAAVPCAGREDRHRPCSTPRSVAPRRSPRPKIDDRSCAKEKTTACCRRMSRKPQHGANRTQVTGETAKSATQSHLEWLTEHQIGGVFDL